MLNLEASRRCAKPIQDTHASLDPPRRVQVRDTHASRIRNTHVLRSPKSCVGVLNPLKPVCLGVPDPVMGSGRRIGGGASGWVGVLIVLTLGLVGPVRAEQMFVIDKVVLNVYAEPNQEGGKVAALETGDLVEVIDQLEPYVKVRLQDTREGWVRSNYLSRQPPAIVRLKELQSGQPAVLQGPPPQVVQELQELRKHKGVLESEVARLKGVLENEVSRLRDEAGRPPPRVAEAAKPQLVGAVTTATTHTAVQKSEVRNRMWAWFAVTVTAGGLGFLGGYQTLATRIKRKYGDIKIY